MRKKAVKWTARDIALLKHACVMGYSYNKAVEEGCIDGKRFSKAQVRRKRKRENFSLLQHDWTTQEKRFLHLCVLFNVQPKKMLGNILLFGRSYDAIRTMRAKTQARLRANATQPKLNPNPNPTTVPPTHV